jgi:alpha-galactosidase
VSVIPDPAEFPGCTTLVLADAMVGGPLPSVHWVGAAAVVAGLDAATAAGAAAAAGGAGYPLLPEQSRGWFTRPGLIGHRVTADGPGRDWSTAFTVTAAAADRDRSSIDAVDEGAGLALRTEIESLAGGALRVRHLLTNTAPDAYLVEALDVSVVVPDRVDEVLDFSGRWGFERAPQRHGITDGTWTRENRRGKTGHDNATVVCVGERGFSFADADVWAVHLAWSGNGVYRVERTAASPTVLSAGELLLPGEIALAEGETYATPWVHIVAVDDGLDGVAAAFHTYLRSLPAHPRSPVPVNLNVWEAVYFRHDLDELKRLADIAARIGVERYVLDDGWFGSRRDDHSGLGDWVVSADIWPQGLGPLVDHVTALGMEFGLWFEPEMVNPDSDLYRAHPDWILAAADRIPILARNQLVLDLSRADVRQHLLDQMSAVLSAYDIGYVKWDHNRDLLEAGTASRERAPAIHEHTLGFYALIDELRRRHPRVQWESCASGGGRVDLGVLERMQRVWTSDVTDALARQSIQRWNAQLAAPEYLGAHISAPVSHQTNRTFDLSFRAATALFGSFGIEWDISSASPAQLDELAGWIALYRTHRELLHTGRMVRVDSADPAVAVHGVVAADQRTAVMAYVQLDQSVSERPVPMRIPGLLPTAGYRARWLGPAPGTADAGSHLSTIDPLGPVGDATITGPLLAAVGLPMPRRRPETISLVLLEAV